MAATSDPVAAVHSAGLPAERAERLAAVLRLPPWHPPPQDRESRVLVLVGDATAAEDPALWEPPFTAWVEAASQDDAAVAREAEQADRTHLYACLTTATANRLHIAGRIMHAIAARRPLSETRRDDIELALHEAISNAVVHGNLQVQGMRGLSMDALDRFSHELAQRMADPAFAGRRVAVSCWLDQDGALLVDVADEGSGFAPPSREERSPGASGRGLDIIAAIAESVELLDQGRRIRMRFAL